MEQAEKPKIRINKTNIRVAFALFLLLTGLVSFLAFVSFCLNWQADQSQLGDMLNREVRSSNTIGKLGDWLGNIFIFQSIGLSAFILSFLALVGGTNLLKIKLLKPWKTFSHCLFFIVWTPIFLACISQGEGVMSGVYGYQIMDYLSSIIGSFGLYLVLFFSLALYFILEFNLTAIDYQALFSGFRNKIPSIEITSEKEGINQNHLNQNPIKPVAAEDAFDLGLPEINSDLPVAELVPEVITEDPKEIPKLDNIDLSLMESSASAQIPEKKDDIPFNVSRPEAEKIPEPSNEPKFNIQNTSPEPEVIPDTESLPFSISVPEPIPATPLPVLSPAAAVAAPAFNIENPVMEDENFKPNEDEDDDGDEEGKSPDYSKVISEEDAAKTLVEKHGFYDHTLDLANFSMPKIDMLKDYGNENITINQHELEENKNKIVELLRNFNVGISEIKATIGPTVTLYEIVPEAGIRVAQIKKLQDDIALNLSALGIRIIAPMPGKGTIGIEVPNQKPSMVSMRSVINSAKFQNCDMDLPIVFGKTISNDIFVADLAKMPHLLMAGATGQGKSVGINAILASLLYKKHPSELKFVMVDPKKVELSLYSKIERHYLAKLPDTDDAIITDNHKVIATLNSLCLEMDNRYELLKNAFCKNLKEYNQKFKERRLNPENGHRYLPYIVLVVDEFADLIMTAGKEVEIPIARLAQLARAVGIHLIVATQRPSVNVITGMIKANFPARVAFRVISSTDSRTILDSNGAEQLVGKGDMLYFNGNEIIRLQCAFIDTPEVEKLAEYVGAQKGYASAFMLPEVETTDNLASAGGVDPNERDSMFEEAARVIVGTQQGSTSMIQRQLKLGYNRAGRIMDQLEACGVVGGFNGAKAREVLISDINNLEVFLQNLKS